MSSIGRHHHHHHHRHHHRHRHRHRHHLGEMKLCKKANRTIIHYMERSPQTDHLNKAVDEMIVLFAQALENDNVTFSLRKE